MRSEKWGIVSVLDFVHTERTLSAEEFRAASHGEFIKIEVHRLPITMKVSKTMRKTAVIQRWSDSEKVKKLAREEASKIQNAFIKAIEPASMFFASGYECGFPAHDGGVWLIPRAASTLRTVNLAMAHAEASLEPWADDPARVISQAFSIEYFDLSKEAAIRLLASTYLTWQIDLFAVIPKSETVARRAEILGLSPNDPFVGKMIAFSKLANELAKEANERGF